MKLHLPLLLRKALLSAFCLAASSLTVCSAADSWYSIEVNEETEYYQTAAFSGSLGGFESATFNVVNVSNAQLSGNDITMVDSSLTDSIISCDTFGSVGAMSQANNVTISAHTADLLFLQSVTKVVVNIALADGSCSILATDTISDITINGSAGSLFTLSAKSVKNIEGSDVSMALGFSNDPSECVAENVKLKGTTNQIQLSSLVKGNFEVDKLCGYFFISSNNQQVFDNISGYLKGDGMTSSFLAIMNVHEHYTEGCSLLSFGDKGYEISSIGSIYVGGGVLGGEYPMENKNFTYLLHAKGSLTLSDCPEIIVSGNILKGENASALFFDSSSGNLVISNNGVVEFSLNLAESGAELPYAIRSKGGKVFLNTKPLQVNSDGSSADIAQSYIRFYQPVLLNSNVELNQYGDSRGSGEICFSGENVDAYLATQMRIPGTELQTDTYRKERIHGRASVINGNVTLYGGTLSVVDTAILEVNGELLVKDGATVVVEPFAMNVVESGKNVMDYSMSAMHVTNLTLEPNATIRVELGNLTRLTREPVVKVDGKLKIENMESTSTGNLNDVPVLFINQTQPSEKGLVTILSASEISADNRTLQYKTEGRWVDMVSQKNVNVNDFWASLTDTHDSIRCNTDTVWILNKLYTYTSEPIWVKGLSMDKTWRGDSFEILDTDKFNVRNGSIGRGEEIDSDLCWAYAASNVIQYWQDKYAPLYQGDSPLVTNRTGGVENADQVMTFMLKNIVQNASSSARRALDWWLSDLSMDSYLKDFIKGDRFASKKNNEGWWETYGIEAVREDIQNSDKSFDNFCNTITEVFKNSYSPIALSYKGHVFTCWGIDVVDQDDKVVAIYFTDSDGETLDGEGNRLDTMYSTMFLTAGPEGEVQVIFEESELNRIGENMSTLFYIPDSSKLDNMLVNLRDASRPMYWTGKAAEWKPRSLEDASGAHLAEFQDGWKKEVGEGIWAHAYFHNETNLPGSDYDNLKASSTGFVFADTVDGVILSKERKKVLIPNELQVKAITVEGKDYVFEGSGMENSVTLTAADGMLVQNGGELTLSGNVNISGTPIVLNSGSLKAYIPGRTTITGGSVTLLNNSILWCAGLVIDDVFSDGAIAIDDEYYITSRMISVGTSSSDMSRNMTTTILSDGSGRLGAYVDFGGSSVDFYTLMTFGNNRLDSVFSNMAGVEDAPSEYKYVYEWRRFTTEATADELSADKLAVADSTLTITGGSSRSLTIGSHSLTADENSANVSVSEELGGRVKSAAVLLSTVMGEDSYFSAETEVSVPQLTVAGGSVLMNDGWIGSNEVSSQIVVEKDAQMGGSGRFTGTLVKAGGSLVVGSSPGAPVYDDLTMESGSALIFYVDGTQPANAEMKGWGSGTYSQLTVTGTADIALGTEVRVGCSLDFLNAADLGETLTLTLVKLSESAGDALPAAMQSGTTFYWADEDQLNALSEVGACIHDSSWSRGSGNTLQLSFIVSSCPEGALRWTNAGGNGIWDAVTQNWQDAGGSGTVFSEGKSVVFYDGGSVQLSGTLTPDTVVVSSSGNLTLSGNGSLSGEAKLIKEGNGGLVIGTANSYSGGTTLYGGTLTVAHAEALGSSGVRIAGGELIIAANGVRNMLVTSGKAVLTVQPGYALSLTNPIFNTGSLTISGTLDVSEMVEDFTPEGADRVDVSGNAGAHGFANSSGCSVVVVEGAGTVQSNGAAIVAHGVQLTLGSDGVASIGSGISYASYLVGSGHSVKLSDIVSTAAAHGCNSVSVELSGGRLTADAALSENLMSSGNSTLLAQNWQQTRVITNSGTLSISGTIAADALDLVEAADILVNTDGQAGSSGFVKHGDSYVVLVNGGTTVNDGVTVTHGDRTFTLGSNGVATLTGSVDYSRYFLNGTDTATVSDILAKAPAASVVMDGGTLTADASVSAEVTGGCIHLQAGSMSGSINNATLNVSGGELNAVLSGNNSLNAENWVVNRAISNSGTLTLRGHVVADALELSTIAATRIDTEGRSGSSGFEKASGYRFTMVMGGTTQADGLNLMHSGKAFTLNSKGEAVLEGLVDYSRYLLTGMDTASASAILSQSAKATVVQDGGTLTADASVEVTSTGGSINLLSGILSGSISGSNLSVTDGSLSAELRDNNILHANNWKITQAITNSGALSLSGNIDAGALNLTYYDVTRVDVSGAEGKSGFLKNSGSSFTLVEGGSVSSAELVLTHSGILYTLDSNGVAKAPAHTNYSSYLADTGHSVRLSEIVSRASANGCASTEIELKDATLTADTSLTGNLLSSGSSTLMAQDWQLNRVITNSGTLSISGTIAADALTVNTADGYLVDENGQAAENGFRKSGEASLLLVSGGTTVNSGVTVTHDGLEYVLGSNGVAIREGEVDFSRYYMNTLDYATVSELVFASHGQLRNVEMTHGTLTVDTDIQVKAVDSKVNLTSGVLSGELTDTELKISGGVADAALLGNTSVLVDGAEVQLNGNNSHVGGTVLSGGTLWVGSNGALGKGGLAVTGESNLIIQEGTALKLNEAVANSGMLKIYGAIDAGLLELSTEKSVLVDTHGVEGDSGFVKEGQSRVRVISGGVVDGTDAIVLHGERMLTLLSNGEAFAEGRTDYSRYFINGNHSVAVSEIEAAIADGQLMRRSPEGVTMTSGCLDVDSDVNLLSTGGKVELTRNAVLQGSITDTSVSAYDGRIMAQLHGSTSLEINGNVFISNDNRHSGGTVLNSGILEIGHANSLGNGVVCFNGGSIKGNVVSHSGRSIRVQRGRMGHIDGDLFLRGGTLTLESGAGLRVSGSLTLGRLTTLQLAGEEFNVGYELIRFNGALFGDLNLLTLEGIGENLELKHENGSILLVEAETIVPPASGESGDSEDSEDSEDTEDTPVGDNDYSEEDGSLPGADSQQPELPAPTLDRESCDALVQSSWGVFSASHAFADAIGGQRSAAGYVGRARSVAWVSAMGGMHRIDGTAAASGSDIDLYGAAVGFEGLLSGENTVGVAIGRMGGDVQMKQRGHETEQDGTYIGVYGTHQPAELNRRSQIFLKWSAVYGDTETEGTVGQEEMSWKQNSVQLNARAEWAMQLDDAWAVNVFAGMEYFVSESAENGESDEFRVRMGSIQNLRGELGIGSRYTDGSTTLYGEVCYLNDMVRSNPYADINGVRGYGANPGRQGIGVTVGAQQELGNGWSVNASYSLEAMSEATMHSANIGAALRF